jgi:hypothetical protein
MARKNTAPEKSGAFLCQVLKSVKTIKAIILVLKKELILQYTKTKTK